MYLDIRQLAVQHADKLHSPDWGLYFHGTELPFAVADFDRAGTSSDANSALGFFVIDNLDAAANYAEQVRGRSAGSVLVALVREANPYEFVSFGQFYGIDWPEGDPQHDRPYFVRERQRLLAAGHDSAWFVLDDDGVIGIALAAEHLAIVGELSLEDARRLYEDFAELQCGSYLRASDLAYKQAVLQQVSSLAAKTQAA